MDQNLIQQGGSISSSDHHSSFEEGQRLSVFLPVDQNSDQEINSHQGNSSSDLRLKWMSSKMRIMHKMKNGPECTTREWSSSSNSMKRSEDCDCQEIRYLGGSSNISTSNGAVRVCSDCKTTTTPLWRSGPRGPKVSLSSFSRSLHVQISPVHTKTFLPSTQMYKQDNLIWDEAIHPPVIQHDPV